MADPDKRSGGAESYAQKRHYDYHLVRPGAPIPDTAASSNVLL